MHYLVTGHTGFKGSWLVMLLTAQGHTVSGIALDPLPGSLFETAHVAELMEHDFRIDIRDASAVAEAVQRVSPHVVFHMAAQPLVRESYRDPRTTFETNVAGTLNVLEAVSQTPSVMAHIVITTDKVYENVGQAAGYRESDKLGAADPYSSSKAMADILTQSWAKSVTGAPIAIVRGGNVIGGGDNSTDRLIPDLMRAFDAGVVARLRYPEAIRPWQHVLDCLHGYLRVSEAVLAGDGQGAWNIGPGTESFVTVGEVADRAAATWGSGASWEATGEDNPPEAHVLALDPHKATTHLGWNNHLVYPVSLDWTVEWHKKVQHDDSRTVTSRQISRYLDERDVIE